MKDLKSRIEFLSDLYGNQSKLSKKLKFRRTGDFANIKSGRQAFGPTPMKRFEEGGINPMFVKEGKLPMFTNTPEGLEWKKKYELFFTDDERKLIENQLKDNQSKDKLKLVKNTLKPIEYQQLPKISSSAAAGSGTPFNDGLDTIDIPKLLIDKIDDQFVIEAVGDSMMPLIEPEDILVCKKKKAPNPGDVIVCLLNGDIIVKNFSPTTRTVFLKSENEDYKDIRITDDDDFIIFGEVIHFIRKIKKFRF